MLVLIYVHSQKDDKHLHRREKLEMVTSYKQLCSILVPRHNSVALLVQWYISPHQRLFKVW